MKPFVSIILAGLLLFSCTKYEKGPKISFKQMTAKQKRKLLEGNWKMTGLLKNGNDYFTLYQNRPVSDSLSIVEAYITSPTIRDNIPATFYFYTNTHSILSTLSFSPKTNTLACYFFNYKSFNAHWGKPLSNATIESIELLTKGISSYKILRLTENELILKSINLPNEYEIQFQRN
jgi:hypothetical protein